MPDLARAPSNSSRLTSLERRFPHEFKTTTNEPCPRIRNQEEVAIHFSCSVCFHATIQDNSGVRGRFEFVGNLSFAACRIWRAPRRIQVGSRRSKGDFPTNSKRPRMSRARESEIKRKWPFIFHAASVSTQRFRTTQAFVVVLNSWATFPSPHAGFGARPVEFKSAHVARKEISPRIQNDHE